MALKQRAKWLSSSAPMALRLRAGGSKVPCFPSIFNESRDFTKDEFYQLITFPNIKEIVNQKILKIVEERGHSENKITETQEGVMETEE